MKIRCIVAILESWHDTYTIMYLLYVQFLECTDSHVRTIGVKEPISSSTSRIEDLPQT